MEAFLYPVLSSLLRPRTTFQVHSFQGKPDLLGKLPGRLRAYASWLPSDWRIVVVVDRDADDCHDLKLRLEGIAYLAGLRSRTRGGAQAWQLVNRIAVEELEAWYFGDWTAVQAAYPRVPGNVPQRAAFRDPDAIAGGTWEAFERILRRHGYFKAGLGKIQAAREIAKQIDHTRTRSRSFRNFCEAMLEAAT